MKKILIIAAIILAAGVGLWLARNEPTPAPTPVAPPVVQAPAEVTAPTLPAEEVPVEEVPLETMAEDIVSDVIAEGEAAGEEARTAAEDLISDIVAASEDAAAEVESRIADSVAAIEEAGAEVARDLFPAEPTDEPAVEATPGTATEEAAAAPETTTEMASTDAPIEAEAVTQAGAAGDISLDELFTAEGFDHDRALVAIEDAELGNLTRAAARRIMESLRDNPDAIAGALPQLRSLLGL